jgi:hypothetical protein
MNLAARDPGRPTRLEVCIDGDERRAIECRSAGNLGNRFVNDHPYLPGTSMTAAVGRRCPIGDNAAYSSPITLTG